MNEDQQKKILEQKRIYFEPVVFDTLRRQDPERLQTFWDTYQPPLTSEKTICIVERRAHPNFDFIVKNVAYFCKGWSFTIVCSDANYDFVKDLMKEKEATILPYFTGLETPEEGKIEYNALLQTETFWNFMQAEWVLMVEMDSYLLRPLPNEMFEYDYVASHWAWDKSSMGGGLSLRKRATMLELCKRGYPKSVVQDGWVNDGCKHYGYKMPTYEKYKNWFVESCYSHTPIGVHQFWTFWNPFHTYALNEFTIHTTMVF
jgi:hypothetical protein